MQHAAGGVSDCLIVLLQRELIGGVISERSLIYCELFVWTERLFLTYNIIYDYFGLRETIMLPEKSYHELIHLRTRGTVFHI